jgi:uncharacterized DUF497 family protein
MLNQNEEFEWNAEKDQLNQAKHGVSFQEARQAFEDPNRVIVRDQAHSTEAEERLYCVGQVEQGILTVRFTHRGNRIRIFGAGFWRQGRKIYEEQNG